MRRLNVCSLPVRGLFYIRGYMKLFRKKKDEDLFTPYKTGGYLEGMDPSNYSEFWNKVTLGVILFAVICVIIVIAQAFSR